MVVLEIGWWEYLEKHGGTEDYMVDELREAWRYWGHYGESHGRHAALLGTICWQWGTHGGTGGNMMEVLRDAWRYYGTVWWEYWETPGGTRVPL